MNRSLLIGIGIAVLVVSGCKPKAGEDCKPEAKEVCADEKQALVCHKGVWEPMICRGSRGCSKVGEGEVCDQSVAETNDVCNLEHDFVCTADKKRMLECRQGHWVAAQSCLGDRGCTADDKKVVCDNSLANADDACNEENDFACSIDKTKALVCRGGKFVVTSQCKGKNGCRLSGDRSSGLKVDCDDSIANAGDPCDKENNFACAQDQQTILKCVGKQFVSDERCNPKQRCDIRGDVVGCY